MKKYVSIMICGLLCFTALAGCSGADEEEAPLPPDPSPSPTPPESQDPSPPDPAGQIPDTVKATITMDDGGVIELELYPKIAPQSVYNFVYLARQGYYDGLKFHRIMKGFMLQGGCPLGTGGGNPGYSIFGEFAKNGFTNDLKHTRGVLSMARSDNYNSAGSQFFIVHETSSHLDGGYAAFGKVTGGMDVVDRIADTPNNGPDGSVAEADKPVIASITIDTDAELPEPEKLQR